MKKLILAILFTVFTLPTHAGVLIYFLRTLDSSADPIARIPRYYVCDTSAEIGSLTTQQEGDLAYARDVERLFYYNGSATWIDNGIVGADTQVLYNSSGIFAADANFTWNSGSQLLTIAGGFDVTALEAKGTNSHLKSTGTAPAVSSCGTNPSVAGTDTAGKITVGTGISVTSCTLTFNAAYTTAPACVVSANSQLARSTTTTTTTIVITTATTMTSNVISYICMEY